MSQKWRIDFKVGPDFPVEWCQPAILVEEHWSRLQELGLVSGDKAMTITCQEDLSLVGRDVAVSVTRLP
jgi:hypothetical protein